MIKRTITNMFRDAAPTHASADLIDGRPCASLEEALEEIREMARSVPSLVYDHTEVFALYHDGSSHFEVRTLHAEAGVSHWGPKVQTYPKPQPQRIAS